MAVVDEIQHAIGILHGQGASLSMVLLEPQPAERIYKEALRAFVEGGDRRWWWEHFKLPFLSRRFERGDGWRRLPELVPDPHEPAWFIAETDSMPFHPVFETTAASASLVLGECHGFEYCLVAKDLSWLVCENHHDTVCAVGADVMGRLAGVAA